MSSPNNQIQVSIKRESFSGEGEEPIEREGQISPAILAPSVVYPNDKQQSEPYSGTQFSPASSPSSSVPATSANNGPGEGVARRGRPVSEREREKNTLRMQIQRQHLREQKDRIRRLLPRRTSRALPSSELQLWAEAAEYIEYLKAENLRLKKLVGIQTAATTSPNQIIRNTSSSITSRQGMSYIPWEPVSSGRDLGLVNIAGPSNSMTRNSDAFGARAATMMPTPDWSSFWESYDPRTVSAQVQSAPMEETGVRLPHTVAGSAQGNINSEYFDTASDPVWDPTMLNYREGFLAAPCNEILGQHTQTDVRRSSIPNHEAGYARAQPQIHGSTRRLSSSSADSGIGDYRFVFEQQPSHQGNQAFR